MTKGIWPVKKLGEVALIQKGMTITAKTAVSGHVPVIAGGKQPAYSHNVSNRDAGCITVSASGAYAGFVSFHTKPIWASDCITLEPTESGQLTSQFIHYFMLSRQQEIYDLQRGSGMPHVYGKDLAQLEVPVPPLTEQHRIVSVLEDHVSRLDKALAELNHVSSLLKVQRSALVHNQIALLKAENTPMEPLSEVFDMQTGPAFQSRDFTDSSLGIRLLRGENIEPGALRWNNTKFWRHDKLNGFEKYFVQENDLILAMDRPLVSAGLKLAVAKKDDLPCLLVQRVARLRANGKALAEYIYPFLLSLDFEAHLAIESTGTQIPHISMKGIGSFAIPVPSHERQRVVALEMTEAARALDTASQTIEQARLQISTLKRSLLFSAFSGEL